MITPELEPDPRTSIMAVSASDSDQRLLSEELELSLEEVCSHLSTLRCHLCYFHVVPVFFIFCAHP